jgi:hypothetical protein
MKCCNEGEIRYCQYCGKRLDGFKKYICVFYNYIAQENQTIEVFEKNMVKAFFKIRKIMKNRVGKNHIDNDELKKIYEA